MTQTRTVRTTLDAIMQSAAFQRGVEDVRCGRKPNFDKPDEDGFYWQYERGRQFGAIAPRKMKIMVKGQLNERAFKLFQTLSWMDDIL
jgi:hypothetical protein